MKVHVFKGNFEDITKAANYTEPQWEPEPEKGTTDEEYILWEERNPRFEMQADLNCHLDSDFIETIPSHKTDVVRYLKSMVKNPLEVEPIINEFEDKETVLILIFEDAISGNEKQFDDTKKMKYLGEYESTLRSLS